MEEPLSCVHWKYAPPKQLQTWPGLWEVTCLGNQPHSYQILSHLIPLAANELSQINLNGLTQAPLFTSNPFLCLRSVCNNNKIPGLVIFIKVTATRCFLFFPPCFQLFL